MKSEFPPERVMELYARGTGFKENLNLYETVRRNERFYTGDQWYGLKVKKIQPVVLNVLRRVVGTFQAMVVSDDIAFEITPFTADEGRETIGKALEEAVKAVIEKQKIKTKNRKCIRTGRDHRRYVYVFLVRSGHRDRAADEGRHRRRGAARDKRHLREPLHGGRAEAAVHHPCAAAAR